MSSTRFYLILSGLSILLIFFQYRLWFQESGMRDMLKAKKLLAQQVVVNEKLKKQNEELLMQVERMQTSENTTESRARNELGMIKDDEVFYQIVPTKKG